MPQKMLGWLWKIPYVEIIFVDNASTYPPLLEWYDKSMANVVPVPGNFGHMAFFTPYQIPISYGRGHCLSTHIRRSLFDMAPEWFVLTDPDIVPTEDCPLDLLEVMHGLMAEFPCYQKVGIGLKTDDLPDHFPLKARVVSWEKGLIGKQISPRAVEAGVDTTFALYKKDRHRSAFATLRTTEPYMARHLPWYIDRNNLDEEEKYYIDHASKSASWTTAMKNNESKAKKEAAANPYGSHLQVLLTCVKNTKGAVLELGVGDFSTPALHEACSGRLLLSADTDSGWLFRFENLRGGVHQFHAVNRWADPWFFYLQDWDVAFIDSDTPNTRVIAIEKLADRAKFIVVHDTDNSGYEDALAKFKYRYDNKSVRPFTTVVSNFEDPNVRFKGLLP